MYILINKTTNTTTNHTNLPDVDDLLNEGHDIIMISTYSNTVKIPYVEECNGITEWWWKDYNY